MKSPFFSPSLLTAAVLAIGVAAAQATLSWRVSVKIILDSNGNRPTATNQFNYSTPERVREEFAEYNKILGRMGWGYRFDLVEVIELSGVGTWYDREARNGTNRALLEIQAKANPSLYRFRSDALNVYINNSSSGVAMLPPIPLTGELVLVGASGYWSLIFHELGHALGLCHTHGCDCGMCDEGTTECQAGAVDDDIADTVLDRQCWTRNNVSIGNFNVIYSLLNASARGQVDDVWENVMSYHNDNQSNRLHRLTHDQWERIVDVSNFQRRYVTSGKSVFVDRLSSGLSPCELLNNIASLVDHLPGPSSWYVDALNAAPPPPEAFFRRSCQNFTIDPPFPPPPPGYPGDWPWPPTPLFPNPPPGYPSDWPWPPVDPQSFTVCIGGYKTLKNAIDCGAQDGDRLQIKAGNYDEAMRITRPLTLATDRGRVSIGRP